MDDEAAGQTGPPSIGAPPTRSFTSGVPIRARAANNTQGQFAAKRLCMIAQHPNGPKDLIKETYCKQKQEK